MIVWPKIDISDGTEQKGRFPRALEPGYFLPDERRFDELLALGAELAATLPFHNLRMDRKGTWGDLFKDNEAAVMALILSKDPGQLESGFSKCLELGLEEAVRFAYQTAKNVDFWLVRLGRSSGRTGTELSERIGAMVSERLTSELRALETIVGVLRNKSQALDDLDFHGFHRLWGIGQTLGEATRSGDAVSVRDEVQRVFSAFLSVIALLQSIVPSYLAESRENHTHEPATALVIVFLTLLEKVSNRLNGFTDKHLRFYYRDVLGALARQHEPDEIFFSLETAEGQSEVRVPAGTEFVTAGGPAGAEIVFVSERDAVVSDAKLDTLCTLRFERDGLTSPERELGYVTRISGRQCDLDRDAGPTALPLFGAGPRLAGVEGSRDARIGFAVASPVLFLREGQRSIEVEVELEDPAESSQFRNEVLRHAETEGPLDHAVLADIFATYLSAEPDWLEAAAETDFVREAKRLASCIAPDEIKNAFEETRLTGRNQVYNLFLRALLRHQSGDVEVFRRLFGRVFGRYVLTAGECLDADLRQEIIRRAQTLPDESSVNVVIERLNQGYQVIFQKLLKDVFEIHLTTPAGWHRVDRYLMSRLESGAGRARSGLRFLLTLEPEVEPIVPYSPEIHGGQWGGTAPLIRFRLNPRASFCAYSMLSVSRLSSIAIDVEVQGARDLQLYNNVGRIDPTTPFQPFGPLPTLSSYLVFGSHEMARKRLTGLTVNLEWADLPTCYGGFTAHYDGYERAYAGEDFRVDISVLQDGTWQPRLDRQRARVSLFESAGSTGKLKTARSLAIGGLDLFRPIDPKIAEDRFDLQSVRNGFFRLGLSGPEGGFGHADYPALLSKSLSENIRSKVFKAVPNAPYTPLISQVSVDYRARARISVAENRTAEQSARDERVFHLHPFGYEEVEPIRVGTAYSLLPRYETDGNLFIGVTGGRGTRTLGLVFHLSDETNRQTPFESPGLSWYYLSVGGWRRLPLSSVVLDTTNGFLCSGIVVLTLPEDVDRQSTLMPAGKFWVRAGANKHLDSLPGFYSVRTNGVRAIRRIDAAMGETLRAHLPAGRAWRTAASIPGLGAIQQVGGTFGGVPTEGRRRFRTRISERLCHKGRAITAWDCERLVLQRFPNLFKVKCFPGLVSSDAKPRPGRVLVVVVPYAGAGERVGCSRPMVDVLQLKEIRRYVQKVSSPWVEVEVRNPLYERIQVRCKVRFLDDANPGYHLRRLNREVSDFLCPWLPSGYQARFGWMITREEVEGFMRGRDFVKFVTDFSMLHIAEYEEDRYALADTVSRTPDIAPGNPTDRVGAPDHHRSDQVRWRYPWSLAVPMERHFIEALRITRGIKPEPAGIGELDVGGTFIISGTDSS